MTSEWKALAWTNSRSNGKKEREDYVTQIPSPAGEQARSQGILRCAGAEILHLRVDQHSIFHTAMVQHDLDGDILLLLRCFEKWDATRSEELNRRQIRTFQKDARKWGIFPISRSVPGAKGDIERKLVASLCPNLARDCLAIVQKLRTSFSYLRFMSHPSLSLGGITNGCESSYEETGQLYGNNGSAGAGGLKFVPSPV